MRTLGAKNKTIFSLVINEAFLIALCSYVLALPFTALFSALIVRTISNISEQPLVVAVSAKGLLIWLVIMFVGAISASLLPALHAMRFSLREALSFS